MVAECASFGCTDSTAKNWKQRYFQMTDRNDQMMSHERVIRPY
jgi:hypothetical protein